MIKSTIFVQLRNQASRLCIALTHKSQERGIVRCWIVDDEARGEFLFEPGYSFTERTLMYFFWDKIRPSTPVVVSYM